MSNEFTFHFSCLGYIRMHQFVKFKTFSEGDDSTYTKWKYNLNWLQIFILSSIDCFGSHIPVGRFRFVY